jgi:TonB family protein
MKYLLSSLLLFIFVASGFSQNSRYEVPGTHAHTIKKEKLGEANYVNEIMPEFSRYFVLPFKENALLNFNKILPNSQQYLYSLEDYERSIDFVSVDIYASCEGNYMNSESSGSELSEDQKNMLHNVDLGTDLWIKIKFRYKNQSIDMPFSADKIMEGEYSVTVVPEIEAEYPGGTQQIKEYLTENVISKIPEIIASEKDPHAYVKFTVNENGQIEDARIYRNSVDPEIEKLLLDATSRMPKWSPALNSKGIKVRQEFAFQFGGGC